MAENLGTIDIAVKSDSEQIGRSFDEGGKKAGKSIGDSLSSILGRVFGGAGRTAGKSVGGLASKVFGPGGRFGPQTKYGTKFGQQMKGSMGGGKLAKIAGLATKVTLVVGAVVLLGYVIKKVVGVFVNFGKKVSDMAQKFAGLNAEMAVLSAQNKLTQMFRDMDTAEKLSGTIKMMSGSMNRLKNAMAPLKQIFVALTSVIASEVIGLVTDIANVIGGILRFFSPLLKLLAVTIKIVLRAIRIVLNIIMNPISFVVGLFTGSNHNLFNMKEMVGEMVTTNQAIEKILHEIREAKDDKHIENWNRYIGDMGVQLTGGQWNPFPAPNQIPAKSTTTDDLPFKPFGIFRRR